MQSFFEGISILVVEVFNYCNNLQSKKSLCVRLELKTKENFFIGVKFVHCAQVKELIHAIFESIGFRK